MYFCGHCGLIQAPNVKTCPRCGAAVTPGGGPEGQNAYDGTIITAPGKTELSEGSSGSKPDLVREPTQFAGYDSQTERIAAGGNTPVSPSGPDMPFPGQSKQAFVPPPPPVHMSRSGAQFPTTEGGSYPGAVFPSGQGNLLPASQKTNGNGALLVILLILFLVMVVGATTVIFIIGPGRVVEVVTGGGGSTQPTAPPPTSQASTPVLPTPTPTPTSEQQAQSVITSYYSAINSKDYRTAYNLWENYPDSYQNFANGFSNTQHDDYQFGQVLQQSDGTVQVNITLVATTTSSQQSTYQGYYIVGQQSDGSWKIVKGKLSQV